MTSFSSNFCILDIFTKEDTNFYLKMMVFWTVETFFPFLKLSPYSITLKRYFPDIRNRISINTYILDTFIALFWYCQEIRLLLLFFFYYNTHQRKWGLFCLKPKDLLWLLESNVVSSYRSHNLSAGMNKILWLPFL